MKVARIVNGEWRCPVCGRVGTADNLGVRPGRGCACWRTVDGRLGSIDEDGVSYAASTPRFDTAIKIILMCDYAIRGAVRYGTRIGFVLDSVSSLVHFMRNVIHASSRPGVYRFDPPFNPVVTVDTEDVVPLAELYDEDWIWKNKLEEESESQKEDKS